MSVVAQDTTISLKSYINDVILRANHVRREISSASADVKNNALQFIADEILKSSDHLQSQNRLDLLKGQEKSLEPALLDRLELTKARIQAMAEGLHQVASLPDPVGEVSKLHKRPSGIEVGRMRVPIGVILIIYESRPNVTADAAALCIKSGNVTVLRGGSEALHSNQAISTCIHTGLSKAGVSKDVVQVINTPDREAVKLLLQANDEIDIVIPRGGKGLIERITQESKIPLIKHLDGCLSCVYTRRC